ncbi:MAG: YncE family protein [Bacteroidota bacterium]|nr:YncE family protein [Bacteroidota bacterium]MDP4233894.1 YncE family protein [Bacteroidota bacterium]MDP4243566.1 YncE family protein [Bacteroidota bacterium]MDP4289246.1 YncE family protein [Bacteroidota bacterium]
MKFVHRFISASILCLTLFSSCLMAQPRYEFLKKTIIGGEGGWDYLMIDNPSRHLFIAHATQVDVYDLDHDSVIAHIRHTEGVHGVAIGQRSRRGFISCGRSNSVLMFDVKTLDTLGRITVGEKPDAIIYDPTTNRILVMNGKSEDISILDEFTGSVVTTIKLPGGPEFAVADGQGHVFVNLEDESKVVKIDTHADTIMTVWPLAPGEHPTGIAMDQRANQLYIGCGNEKMIVMSGSTGEIYATLPIGKGVDAVAFDPGGNPSYAFSSNGDGTVTIIHGEAPVHKLKKPKFEVVQTLKTQRGARTIALDPRTHNIYLATAEFGSVPAATAENPHPRPGILPGTFSVLKYGLVK